MEETRQIKCDKCKKLVSITDIKYMMRQDGTRFVVCPGCRDKAGSPEDNYKMEVIGNKEKLQKKVAVAQQPLKKYYFCQKCKYKFKFDPRGSNLLKCPYCGGSESVSEHDYPSADALIKMSQED